MYPPCFRSRWPSQPDRLTERSGPRERRSTQLEKHDDLTVDRLQGATRALPSGLCPPNGVDASSGRAVRGGGEPRREWCPVRFVPGCEGSCTASVRRVRLRCTFRSRFRHVRRGGGGGVRAGIHPARTPTNGHSRRSPRHLDPSHSTAPRWSNPNSAGLGSVGPGSTGTGGSDPSSTSTGSSAGRSAQVRLPGWAGTGLDPPGVAGRPVRPAMTRWAPGSICLGSISSGSIRPGSVDTVRSIRDRSNRDRSWFGRLRSVRTSSASTGSVSHADRLQFDRPGSTEPAFGRPWVRSTSGSVDVGRSEAARPMQAG